MSEFLTELFAENLNDTYWRLSEPLIYKSDLLRQVVEVPAGFVTDFASVPRVPVAYLFWGGRTHREAVIHDYLYRIDSTPEVGFSIANSVFLEATKVRKKKGWIRYPMYWGVVIGGWPSYHKKKVIDELWRKWAFRGDQV